MLLHDCIVSAYAEGFSGIYVYCDNPKAVSKEFLTRFEEAYIEAMDELEEDVDCVCSEKEDDIPPYPRVRSPAGVGQGCEACEFGYKEQLR